MMTAENKRVAIYLTIRATGVVTCAAALVWVLIGARNLRLECEAKACNGGKSARLLRPNICACVEVPR